MLGYLVGATAVAAASAAGYQSMAPAGQWYGPTFIGLGSRSKKLALTYDDGPNDPYTLRLLEVLAKHNVRATFFMIGRFVQQRPDIALEVANARHVIGNHTFTHPNLVFVSALQTRVQIEECGRALRDAIGEHSKLFRPPFGGRRPISLRVVRSLGLMPVMWSVTGWDWKAPCSEYVEREVAKHVRGGDVILLHDGRHRQMGVDRSHTVVATDRLITRYKADGYEFVTIPDMMEAVVGHQSSVVS